MKRTVSNMAKRPNRPGGSNRIGPPTGFIALGSKGKSDLQRSGTDPGLSSNKIVSSSSPHSRMSPTIPESSVKCIDAPPSELVKRISEAIGDNEIVDGLICGAIRTLRSTRSKPDQVIIFALLYVNKKYPALFRGENIVESLVGLLKKDTGLDYIKSKGNSVVPVLACNLLMGAFDQVPNWPSLFVKVYVEDSLGDRNWVDHPHCSKFVGNVCTAFGTVPIPKENKSDSGEDSEKKADDVAAEKSKPTFSSRFILSYDLVRIYAIDMVKEKLGRRQGPISAQDPTGASFQRHLIQTLSTMCGISEVRNIASHKLEMWLQNPKLAKPTQNLLMSICVNCKDHNQDDVDALGLLTRMRLKSKALLNYYILCLKEVIDVHTENMSTLFSYVVYNELSSARNPTNMSVIAALLQHKPEIAATTLAQVCQDLLLQQEDYLRAVRALVREIVRIAKHDVSFSFFALGMMKEPDLEKFSQLDQAHKERFVSAITDLICLIMLVSISPVVKESIAVTVKNQAPTTELNHESIYLKHKLDIAAIQRDGIWWLHVTVVPKLLPKIVPGEYVQILQKLLFLKSSESYYMKDNWPPESERSFMVRHCSEVPILEDTIMRLAVIGLSHEHPQAPADTVDLIYKLVRRAGILNHPGFNPIPMERRDVIDTLLSLSQYHHPENIQLPSDYVPPSLAISVLYWNVWQTLLIIASYNPETVGLQGWNEYPTLKNFMEMTIIMNFTFPLVTISDENERNRTISKELQMVEMEKNEIIEFESHLAAATTRLAVTEETSLLLSQLIAMDTRGAPRRPPDVVLNQTRSLCGQIQLGASLCRSRNPDFLLDIINRHGEDQALPWLSGLVSSARGDMGMLPVQCLCEFLMTSCIKDKSSVGQKDEIIKQLQTNLMSSQLEESTQVMYYFLRRLHLSQYETRVRAKQALSLVLSNLNPDMETDELSTPVIPSLISSYSWLLKDLISLVNYPCIRSKVVDSIQEAVMCDTDADSVAAYLTFLADDLEKQNLDIDNSSDENLQYVSRLSLTTARLIIDRQVLTKIIITSSLKDAQNDTTCSDTVGSIYLGAISKIFWHYLQVTRKKSKSQKDESGEEAEEEIPWRDTQDEIFLRWPLGGGTAQVHILITHAMILLLSYGAPSFLKGDDGSCSDNDCDKIYRELMNVWFTDDGTTLPKAYLMDTQEEALLLPDWLRLRLLQCKISDITTRLSIAASKDLEVEQLLLFIQSFGVPYVAMDQLLKCLDEYCMKNPQLVISLVKDNKDYLIRLVEVQWNRGCTDGIEFHALISSLEQSSSRPSVIQSAPSAGITEVVDLTAEDRSDDVIMIASSDNSSQERALDASAMETNESITDMFQDLFMTSMSSENNKVKQNRRFRTLIRSLTNSKSISLAAVSSFLEEMHALLTAKKTGPLLVGGLFAKTHWSCCLLRAIDSALKRKTSNTAEMKVHMECACLFDKIISLINTKPPANVPSTNQLCILSRSWSTAQSSTDKSEELGQIDWARFEEFLEKQLAFLERDEEIKKKVALVAQILLEEIGSRKTKAIRGKSELQDDKFRASIGATGLLIDWLQILDPELLAHRPVLQRKLLFESQRTPAASMPLKMSSKMNLLRQPHTFRSHQTYLLSLLVEHSNWGTIHKCLQWLLCESAGDTIIDKGTKSSSDASINVDPQLAMDFLWACIHTSKIWMGIDSRSRSLKKTVLHLNANQFCRVLSFMVSSSTKRNTLMTSADEWRETSYFDLFLIFYNKFGQNERRSKNLSEIAKYVYKKAIDKRETELWWQILAQLYIMKPYHGVWKESQQAGGEDIVKNSTLAKAITSTEVGSICRMDGLVQQLINRIGYVRESANVETRDSVTVIQSTIDNAYNANILLKKLASSHPAIVLRQLPLIHASLSGRTWYEFREFKCKNHLLFMNQLIGVLYAIGRQLFETAYTREVNDIIETYFQMIWNYCSKARKQMKDVTYSSLKLVLNFLKHSPYRAYRIVSKHMYLLQSLMKQTYGDHQYFVAILTRIIGLVESAAVVPPPQEGETLDVEDSNELELDAVTREQMMPLLKMISKDQELENFAQVLSELSDTNKKKFASLELFLPHLARLFSMCSDSSIRHTALNIAILCMRDNPSHCLPQVLPSYLYCLTGNKAPQTNLTNWDIKTKTCSGATESGEDPDLIARDALEFLPEMVTLCHESAEKILMAAFDCGSKSGVGVQAPGTMGVIGTQLATGGTATWLDLSEILAKSISLLSGLSISDTSGQG